MVDKEFVATKDLNEVSKIHSNPKYANWKYEYVNGEYRFYSPNYSKKDNSVFSNIENNDAISREDGVLEVNDNPISVNVVDNIPSEDKVYLVHSTDFFPKNRIILSNADGRKLIPFQYQVDEMGDNDIFVEKTFASPRKTVHFSINSKVKNTSKGEGSWDNPKFIILEPYTSHKDEIVSGKIHNGDNYTNESVKLSDEAILMVREDVYSQLTEEQKQMYNIVKYSGNSDICVDNLLTSMGIPIVENYADDKTHFASKQYAQEYVLEKRSKAIKLIKNVYLAHHHDNYFFTAEDIAMLYYLGDVSKETSDSAIKKINEEYNLDSEYIANFILSNGIVRYNGGYSLLSVDEVEEHLNDPDYYIERIKRSGLGLTELKEAIKNINIDLYKNNSLLEKKYKFDDIAVANLQVLQNFDTIKHLKQQLEIDKDKVFILREDGLYLSDRIERKIDGFDIFIQDYTTKNDSEILLGKNGDTLREVKNKYESIVNKKNSENNDLGSSNSINSELEAMLSDNQEVHSKTNTIKK